MKHILVHGLGQTPAGWERTVAQLEDKENIICLDLAELVRGQEVTYGNLYKAFVGICNELDGQMQLCGLSLGGVLALNYAIDYPEKVRSLVLIGSQYKMPKNLLRFQNLLFKFMPKSAFTQMGFGKADFIGLCRTMMDLDFSDSLQKVTCPVLVVCGEKDSANKKASMELADKLENARLQIIPGAGHEVNVEAPEALAEVLNNNLFRDCVAE